MSQDVGLASITWGIHKQANGFSKTDSTSMSKLSVLSDSLLLHIVLSIFIEQFHQPNAPKLVGTGLPVPNISWLGCW
jgi:hypothetical protein